MKAVYNLPAPRPNLRTLGLPIPLPARVVAPAPRASDNLSPSQIAHITRLLGAALNLEASATELAKYYLFSPLLQDELRVIAKRTRAVNERFLKEFSTQDAHLIDTMNRAGNLLNSLSHLILHVPAEVADKAACAAAEVIKEWKNTPKS